MVSIVSIVRFSFRMLQIAADDIGLHTVQDSAVEEEAPARSSLGVA